MYTCLEDCIWSQPLHYQTIQSYVCRRTGDKLELLIIYNNSANLRSPLRPWWHLGGGHALYWHGERGIGYLLYLGARGNAGIISQLGKPSTARIIIVIIVDNELEDINVAEMHECTNTHASHHTVFYGCAPVLSASCFAAAAGCGVGVAAESCKTSGLDSITTSVFPFLCVLFFIFSLQSKNYYLVQF